MHYKCAAAHFQEIKIVLNEYLLLIKFLLIAQTAHAFLLCIFHLQRRNISMTQHFRQKINQAANEQLTDEGRRPRI